MKKILPVFLACLWALAALTSAQAQELGNPVKFIPQGQVSLGLSTSYLFEQKNQDYDLHTTSSDGSRSLLKCGGQFEGDQTDLLSLTYGLRDWLNVFGQAGMVHGGKTISPNLSNGQEWESKLKDEFVWALGAKAQAFRLANGLALGLGARYLRYDDRALSPWHENKSGYDDTQDWRVDEKIDYWQVDLTGVLSLSLGRLTPYAGLGYTYAEAKETGRNTNIHDGSWTDYDTTIRNQDRVLALAGLEMDLGHGCSLYAQGEFLARSSLGLGLAWTF